MKRKDPPCRSSVGLDPRDFAWHKFHRDQFPNIGDRVWLKSEQSYGRIVDTSDDAFQEVQGPQGHGTTEDHNDDDGPCRDEVNHNDPGDKNQKASSIDEPCRGSSLRMVRLEKDPATTVPLRRPHDAVRIYAPPAIIICHDTDDFRRLAQTQDLGDNNNGGGGVLEIGCSTGRTSRIVWPRLRNDDCGHRWMGWDTGQTMVDKVQDEIDQYIIDNNQTKTSGRMNKDALVCCKIDAMVDPETAWQMAIDHFCPPTTSNSSSNITVLIDIGGNRNAQAVAKILQWALELPGHGSTNNNNKTVVLRMVIIKSEEMFALDDPMNWFLDTQQQRLDVRSSLTTISTAAADSSSTIGIKTFPSHPLKAPKRYSPHDPTQFVCRYHNYHPKGCQKGEACEFDHTHCHWCLQAGHKALDCPTQYE